MKPKGNQPDQSTAAEKGTEQKRRYQSGPTPPQMPRDTKSSSRDEARPSAWNGDAGEVVDIDLQRASREQLIEQARKLEIVGYEEMSREDLVRRIQEAR